MFYFKLYLLRLHVLNLEILFLFSNSSGISRLDDQIFINRNPGVPSVVKFHPFNSCIAVADKDSIWSGQRKPFQDLVCGDFREQDHMRLSSFLHALVSGTGRRARGWTTSTMATLVTLESQLWST